MEEQKETRPKSKLIEIEEKILSFWSKEEIFKKSLEKKGKDFVFYDGPPFATGLPHYGHLLAGTIKDVIPRYQTMRGKYVERTFGWDCHGLGQQKSRDEQSRHPPGVPQVRGEIHRGSAPGIQASGGFWRMVSALPDHELSV